MRMRCVRQAFHEWLHAFRCRISFRTFFKKRNEDLDMNGVLKGVLPALTLSLAAALPLSAHATSLPSFNLSDFGTESLSSTAKWNRNLDAGDYVFGKAHTSGSFLDEWKFTLAEDSSVTISLHDLELTLPFGYTDIFSDHGRNEDRRHSDHDRRDDRDDRHHSNRYGSNGHHGGNPSGSLLDNKYLTFSLFDSNDNLLGSSGENGSLTGLNLIAGEWYTLTVSGKVAGLFGSFYYGKLSVEPVQAVPLGDTLPLFGSALALLALRARKKIAGSDF
jgi:hypothetical protein